MNRRQRIAGGLLLSAGALGLAVAILPAFPQPPAYHDFADQRRGLGVPNLFNVISNLPFLLVAWLGWRVPPRPGDDRPGNLPYTLLFLALAATGLGSAYYHLVPDNARLFWDRLPMSLGFAALVTTVIAERRPLHGPWLLLTLVGSGLASLLWWRYSARLGMENLLPYLAFQAWSLLTLIWLPLLFPSRDTPYLIGAVLLYGVALGAGQLDRFIFSWGGLVSGHTLKHLVAALALYQIVRLLRAAPRNGADLKIS
ncbi:alkaline phytoceramidase [Sedimenticola hydrogenitrophicus]|uniref:alkaline phytoceramidase n=1 Tax=Sedimenticola hydrogenitrophicus TaxID=2967975 RepID=UPI0023AF646E|nr:alkaline phytoceramidase [Sedimenticola hydrogenitrophicus]